MSKKKILYHKELVGMGDVAVEQVSEVIDCKSKPGSKLVFLKIAGDHEERPYWLEHNGLKGFFDGNNGRRMVIRAGGSRNDATIEWVEDASGHSSAKQQPQHTNGNHAASNPPPAQAGQAAGAPAPRREPEPPQSNQPHQGNERPPATEQPAQPRNGKAPQPTLESNLAEAKAFFVQRTNLMLMALRARKALAKRWHEESGESLSNEEMQGIKTSMYMDATKAGKAYLMPDDRFLPKQGDE